MGSSTKIKGMLSRGSSVMGFGWEAFFHSNCGPQSVMCSTGLQLEPGCLGLGLLLGLPKPGAETGGSALRRVLSTPLFIYCPSPSLAFVSCGGLREWGLGALQPQNPLTHLAWTS